MMEYKKEILQNTDIKTEKIIGILNISNKIIFGLNSNNNPYE